MMMTNSEGEKIVDDDDANKSDKHNSAERANSVKNNNHNNNTEVVRSNTPSQERSVGTNENQEDQEQEDAGGGDDDVAMNIMITSREGSPQHPIEANLIHVKHLDDIMSNAHNDDDADHEDAFSETGAGDNIPFDYQDDRFQHQQQVPDSRFNPMATSSTVNMDVDEENY